MAGTNITMPATFAIPVTEKLNKNNYTIWKLQVLPAIRGAQFVGYIDSSLSAPPKEVDGGEGKEKVPNPAYAAWLAQDQQVFSYLVSSLSKDALKQISGCETATQIWSTLEELYASQTQVRAVNTCIALATTKKGAMSIDEYIAKMKGYADEMAAAGKPLDDEELVSFICTGLDFEYNSVVTSVLARTEPISVTELIVQLLAFEQRLNLYNGSSSSLGSSVNAASRSRGGGRTNRGRGNRGRGNQGRGRGRGGFGNNFRSKDKCQICKRDNTTPSTATTAMMKTMSLLKRRVPMLPTMEAMALTQIGTQTLGPPIM